MLICSEIGWSHLTIIIMPKNLTITVYHSQNPALIELSIQEWRYSDNISASYCNDKSYIAKKLREEVENYIADNLS